MRTRISEGSQRNKRNATSSGRAIARQWKTSVLAGDAEATWYCSLHLRDLPTTAVALKE
jgi:hypothetical protein